MPRARVTNFGGDNGIRTRDLLHAMQALSQLSYVPTEAIYLSKFGARESRRWPDPVAVRYQVHSDPRGHGEAFPARARLATASTTRVRFRVGKAWVAQLFVSVATG